MGYINNKLFQQMTWSQFQNLYTGEDGQRFSNLIDQQIIYISDKNLYVKIKVGLDKNKFPLIANNQYLFTNNGSIDDLIGLGQQLAAGLYLIAPTPAEEEKALTDASLDLRAKLFYYNGTNKWYAISGSGDGGFSDITVNGAEPNELGTIWVTAKDIYFGDANNQPIGNNLQTIINNIQNNAPRLEENHQWYGGKSPDGTINEDQSLFRKGNLHIDGYYEGKVDGGGW